MVCASSAGGVNAAILILIDAAFCEVSAVLGFEIFRIICVIISFASISFTLDDPDVFAMIVGSIWVLNILLVPIEGELKWREYEEKQRQNDKKS